MTAAFLRPPNQGVQLTPLARPLGWARFTRQCATALRQRDNPQLSDAPGVRKPRRSNGQPHAHCLAAASARRPPRSTRPPAAQLTPGVGPLTNASIYREISQRSYTSLRHTASARSPRVIDFGHCTTSAWYLYKSPQSST